jgi:hypothetical protein
MNCLGRKHENESQYDGEQVNPSSVSKGMEANNANKRPTKMSTDE